MNVLTRCIVLCVLALGLLATSARASEVTVAWDCTGECLRTMGFRMYQRQSSDCSNPASFSQIGGDLPATARSMTILQLQEGLTYCWYVRAFNNAGESGASNTLVFQVPMEEQPPGPASNLHIINTRQSWVGAPTAPSQQVMPPAFPSPPFWLNNDGMVTTKPKRK